MRMGIQQQQQVSHSLDAIWADGLETHFSLGTAYGRQSPSLSFGFLIPNLKQVPIYCWVDKVTSYMQTLQYRASDKIQIWDQV